MKPIAVVASEVLPRKKPTHYPEPFAARMVGREKRPLGEVFSLDKFGVNLTRLAPGAISALRHAHSQQDELVYVLRGTPTLITDRGRTLLYPGMCAGFKAGGEAHHLVNESEQEVEYIEIGDRTASDSAFYPDDDIEARAVAGGWRFTRKDGTPY